MMKSILIFDQIIRRKYIQMAAWQKFQFCFSTSAVIDRESNNDLKIKIKQNTRISRQHLTPEIALHLITSDVPIYHEPITEDFAFTSDPFWGFYWPGGQALTRYILDNAELVAGRSVLDIGCGCGASAIAAKLGGATTAVANDIDEVALLACDLNANLNHVKIETCSSNLIGTKSNRFDVILVGDLFYDEQFSKILIPWLNDLKAEHRKILIGDPGRQAFNSQINSNFKLLSKYKLPDNCCIENNGFSHAFVWEF